jgi:heme/copper-type cytochrome/quinol oxidase subunit 2
MARIQGSTSSAINHKGLEKPIFPYYHLVPERRKEPMNQILDVEWIAAQAGVPVSFLIAIPVFLVFVFTLASMMGSKEPDNYRIGRHAEVKRTNTWVAPVGLFILIVIAVTGYGYYFLPH